MESKEVLRAPQPDPVTRVAAFLEVVLVAILGDLLVVPLLLQLFDISVSRVFQDSGVLFLLMIAKSTVTLLLITLLLRLHGESLRVLSWGGRPVIRHFAVGILYVPLLFGVITLLSLFFEVVFPDYVTEKNPLLEMLQEPKDLFLFLVSSVYVGGLQEEIQRAFVLTRFRQYLGGTLLGLILWSVFFGVGHSIQGVDNAVKAGFLGVLFGILYLRRGLTAPIVSHSVFDIATVVAYWQFVRP